MMPTVLILVQAFPYPLTSTYVNVNEMLPCLLQCLFETPNLRGAIYIINSRLLCY